MVTGGWYVCPTCGKRLQKIPSDAILCNVPIWCRPCKIEWYPSIFDGQELGPDDPFPLNK